MFRDSQKERERIQQQLLEEDDIPETDEELLDDIGDIVDDVQNGYEADAYNSDDTDLPPEALSDEVLAPQRENLKGLIVAACLLTLGIVLVLGWWVVRLMG